MDVKKAFDRMREGDLDNCATLGGLRQALEGLPDDTRVFSIEIGDPSGNVKIKSPDTWAQYKRKLKRTPTPKEGEGRDE